MKMKKGSGRLIGGLIVLALGVFLLLDALDVLEFDVVWEVVSWIASIGMIVFGLGMLIAQRFQRAFLPIALILGGGFILLGNLGYDATRYWPVILIIVGVGLLLGLRRRQRASDSGKSPQGSGDVTVTRTTIGDDVDISCTLGEANERVDSQDFRGGAVNVTMGNVGLDLRDAVVVDRPATLNVNITMGGLVVRVPKEWGVSVDNVVTMGEAEDKRTSGASDPGEPQLVVAGKVTMGSLTIDD